MFSGILTETLGWVYAFYVPAVITTFITVMWFFFVYDSPAQHPRIDKTELELIEKALGTNISKKKVHKSQEAIGRASNSFVKF